MPVIVDPQKTLKRKEYLRKWRLDHKEQVREYSQQWRIQNHVHLLEVIRKRYADNPEIAKARTRKWHNAHPGIAQRVRNKWALAHSDTNRMVKRNWRKKNPEKIRVLAQNYRTKKRGNGGRLTHEDWLECLEKAGYRCQRCRSTENISLDHIVPVSSGGRTDKSNIQVLCLPCNQSKGAKTIDFR